jgi:lipopolysaccharide transport system permease protein
MQPGLKELHFKAPWIIFSNFLGKIYIQRGLIRNFVVRDLRARYIGSFMGLFWSVIHPIVLLVSYTFVFSHVLGVKPPPDTGTTSFPLFLFCGILPWRFFEEALLRSSTVIIENSNLVTKTLFPSEILPLTVLLVAFVNHLIGFGILLCIIFFTIGKVSFFILLIPVYCFLLMLFTLGISWFISSLNVFMRDASQVISVILIFWFWFTPIFYTIDKFPHKLLFLIRFNPVAPVVLGYRDCLIRMRMPNLSNLALLALVSLVIFAAGGLFFRKTKREFVDIL